MCADSNTRSSPSTRYKELINYYREMHEEGYASNGQNAEKTFSGNSLFDHAEIIERLVRQLGVNSLLDYGSGKGQQYGRLPIDIEMPDGRRFVDIPSFWGVEVSCYDPGYEPFSKVPGGKFDAVICTDVLEHCFEQDLPWIIEEMFSLSGSMLYANAAAYPAVKQLPTGENAHITIRPPEWWKKIFEQAALAYPSVRWLVGIERIQSVDGREIMRRDYVGNMSVPKLMRPGPRPVPRAPELDVGA